LTRTGPRDLSRTDPRGLQGTASQQGIEQTAQERGGIPLLPAVLTRTGPRDLSRTDPRGLQGTASQQGIDQTAQEREVILLKKLSAKTEALLIGEVGKEPDHSLQAAGHQDAPDKGRVPPEMVNQKQDALNRFTTIKRKNAWFDRTLLLILFPFR